MTTVTQEKPNKKVTTKIIFGSNENTYEVGKNGVSSIYEWSAAGEGDRWRWIVHFEDGHEETVFDVKHSFHSWVYDPHVLPY